MDGRAEAARLLLSADREVPLPPQPLSSWSPALVPLAAATPIVAAVDSAGQSWLQSLVPPLGGQRNTLAAEAYAILRVAVLSLAGLIILILAAAVLLWLSR